jgi:hypothetical protein
MTASARVRSSMSSSWSALLEKGFEDAIRGRDFAVRGDREINVDERQTHAPHSRLNFKNVNCAMPLTACFWVKGWRQSRHAATQNCPFVDPVRSQRTGPNDQPMGQGHRGL